MSTLIFFFYLFPSLLFRYYLWVRSYFENQLVLRIGLNFVSAILDLILSIIYLIVIVAEKTTIQIS